MISGLLFTVLAIASAYIIGSIPTSYIFGKLFRGIDIREHGSGNAGATNVARTIGKAPGIAVLVIDIAKGVFAVTVVCGFFESRIGGLVDVVTLRAIMGIAVIGGHIWTVFLKFRGGKGIATTLGVMAVISPAAFVVSLLVWLAAFMLTGYVSLSSILLVVTCPIFSAFFGEPLAVVLFTIAVCVMTTYRHTSNILRLLNKTESKLVVFKRKVKL